MPGKPLVTVQIKFENYVLLRLVAKSSIAKQALMKHYYFFYNKNRLIKNQGEKLSPV